MNINIQYVMEFVAILFVSMIANILMDKIRSWWREARDNRRRRNPRNVRGVRNTSSARPSANPGNHQTNANRSSATPPLPVRNQTPPQNPQVRVAGGRTSPPPVPRTRPDNHTNIYDFPKCPIHKCCNRRNRDQVIWWSDSRHMWQCYAGHYFNS